MSRRFNAILPAVMLVGAATAGVAACGENAAIQPEVTPTTAVPVVDPGAGDYAPTIDPDDFSPDIDNPLLPLTVGARWRYEGTDGDDADEVVEITVLDETRTVMGVTARVVRDRVTIDGSLVEDTFDWFAQDREGNVWYFGEEVKDYVDGRVVSVAGSWEAGVGGALPGIVMPARPEVGDAYRQEFLTGEAEDMFEVRAVDRTIETPYGSFDGAVVTGDWSPLEPEVVEEKYYVPGIGKVAEFKVAGGSGEVLLVEFQP